MERNTTTNGQHHADTSFTALAGAVATHRHDPGNELSVSFERGPTAAYQARDALAGLEQRVDDDLLNDVRLLVSELVTNAIRHSATTPGGEVGLDVSIKDSTIHVEVADPGEGFEPSPRDDEMIKPGGWGLYLVDRIADRWGVVKNRMTRVWFEVDFA
ncbi:MAG: serine/threonine-protein kinase RsbW [Solirubrobacteraceae bacterium]|jgi:anti-sigma regulatory factor (Ser/Thr protein kinase)|nr:serine/threonine-protein kinase RsbW [Solirubrobacteraceae bacterium]